MNFIAITPKQCTQIMRKKATGQMILAEADTMLEQPGAMESRSVGGRKLNRKRNNLKEAEIQCLREERKGGISPLTVSDLVNDVMCNQRKCTQENKQLQF